MSDGSDPATEVRMASRPALLGCATDQPFDATETAQERAQRERQEGAVHDRLERLGNLTDRRCYCRKVDRRLTLEC
jgi:hypothetical protein